MWSDGNSSLGLTPRANRCRPCRDSFVIATRAEIDRSVYELYGLSDDEIRLVVEATT